MSVVEIVDTDTIGNLTERYRHMEKPLSSGNLHNTFMPGSFSAKGRQYTGTGTGTWLLLVVSCRLALLPCAIEPAGPGILAGKLHPYACNRPSSLRTWALTCRYCSRLSVARRAASFSDDLVSTDSKIHSSQFNFLISSKWLQLSITLHFTE